MKTLDFGSLVAETIDFMEPTIPKTIVFRRKLTPDLPCIEGDATQIRQVITNLIANAADAIGDKAGTITISTRMRDCDAATLEQAALVEPLMAVPQEAVRNACCVLIPAGLSFAEATVAETLSSATKGHEVLNTSLGDTVVVLGAGPLGNMLVEMARLRGAAKVIQTQRSQGRLEMARLFGADVLISALTEDPVKRVLEETGGRGADIVICAAPSPQAAAEAVVMTRTGGKVMWFAGLPPNDHTVAVDANWVHYRDLTIYGTFGYTPRHFQLSVDLVASRKINPARYVSHVLPLERINEGFREAIAGRALKVVIRPNA